MKYMKWAVYACLILLVVNMGLSLVGHQDPAAAIGTIQMLWPILVIGGIVLGITRLARASGARQAQRELTRRGGEKS